MRFYIRIEPIWRPPSLACGAIPSNSHIEVEDGEIRFRYGVLFNEKIPRINVASAAGRSWPAMAKHHTASRAQAKEKASKRRLNPGDGLHV